MAKGERQHDRPRLIATKFVAPTRSGPSVARQQLLERLEARQDRKLTLIHGPAGFGKTTLAVQWRERLRKRGAAVAWLSLNSDDNTLDRFLAYLVEAIRSGEPAITLDVSALLETKAEHAAGIVLADLVNELEALERDVYLILDDWHVITDRSVRDAVAFLLEHGPPRFHLVLTSRERPALPLARLRVDDQLTEIAASDLRFNVVESRAFLCDVNELSLDESSVQSLWNSTEGWVAALQLALLSLRSTGATADSIERFSGKHHAIGDYLAENVLDHLPPDVLAFLLSTSILDRLCGDLCAAVSGVQNGQEMLEHLEKQDLFIQPLDDVREWYRYHHLFAAHLQRRLERSAPQRVADLHRTASQWLDEHGHTDEAVAHLLAAGDEQQAVGLVQRDAMWLVEHSYMATLLSLVHRLPAQRLQDRPQLQLAIAWGHCLSRRAAEAHAALGHAAIQLEKQQLSPWDEAVVEARVVEACILIYQDRSDGVQELVMPCIERAETYRPWVVAVAANIMSYVHLQRFEYDAALTLQAWARPFQTRAQGPFSGIYGRCFAGIAARSLGRLTLAAEHFRDALGIANASIGRQSHAARLAEALLGQLMVEFNELDEAERLLDDSRALGVEGGVADFSIATYVSFSRLKMQRGDLAGAHAVLDEGERAASHLGFARLQAAVLCERMRLLLGAGHVDAAARLADENGLALRLDAAVGWDTARLRQVALSRLRRAQGRGHEAVAILGPLLDEAIDRRCHLVEVELRIQLALALDAAGDLTAARHMLKSALLQGLAAGMRRSFLDQGPRLLVLTKELQASTAQYADGGAEWAGMRSALAELVSMGQRAEAVASGSGTAVSSTAGGDASIDLVEPLKDREAEILRRLERGESNKEIARSMAIGVDTVKWYLKSIYSKLGVASRAEAVYAARKVGALG